ncbi:S-adenosyl-L-methionine-dependent methyltransferase [Quillaja saponaria]|uniref:S-adenosyl-L-methionine-dependent methyltransferase n=1 Tax=Quillaja saponaria TaxID=32244 RepID=A0AAD7QD61_QUISA|nr:S-adenosyl-L-methionine-dependent methyltransferase [Quillaja saponaria]
MKLKHGGWSHMTYRTMIGTARSSAKRHCGVADIKFPLPYRAKSFSLVIVSDALDYLSPNYLNKTLPELARVSAEGVVIFTGQQI